MLVFCILPPSDIEDPDIAVELDSKGWYAVKSIDTVVPDLDKGELRVKPLLTAVDILVSICDCVYPVAVVKTELAPHVILPVLSIVHTTAEAKFFYH